MNAQECLDTLEAWKPFGPASDLQELSSLIKATDRGGVWELSCAVFSDSLRPGARYFPSQGESFGEFLNSSAKAAAGASPHCRNPPSGFAWFSAASESGGSIIIERCCSADGARQAIACGPTRGHVRLSASSSDDILRSSDDLCRVMTEFFQLAVPRDVVMEWSVARGGATGRWSLRLKEPVAWPLLTASSLLNTFAPHAGLMSRLALNARVSEITFDPNFLQVHLRA